MMLPETSSLSYHTRPVFDHVEDESTSPCRHELQKRCNSWRRDVRSNDEPVVDGMGMTTTFTIHFTIHKKMQLLTSTSPRTRFLQRPSAQGMTKPRFLWVSMTTPRPAYLSTYSPSTPWQLSLSSVFDTCAQITPCQALENSSSPSALSPARLSRLPLPSHPSPCTSSKSRPSKGFVIRLVLRVVKRWTAGYPNILLTQQQSTFVPSVPHNGWITC